MNDTSSVATQIESRVAGYLEVLTHSRDAEGAGDYYSEGASLVGPGFTFDRTAVLREIRSAFDAGAQIEIDRETLELFVHGDAAYEIATAKDTLTFPDGTSQVLHNNLFICWVRGSNGSWRFSRVLLSPIES